MTDLQAWATNQSASHDAGLTIAQMLEMVDSLPPNPLRDVEHDPFGNIIIYVHDRDDERALVEALKPQTPCLMSYEDAIWKGVPVRFVVAADKVEKGKYGLMKRAAEAAGKGKA